MKKFGYVVTMLGLTLLNTACSFVDATEYCVETRYGKVITPKVETGIITTVTTSLTCFPTTQQQFPGGNLVGNTSTGAKVDDVKIEKVEFLTRDSIMMTADIAINWKYVDPMSAFQTRRTHDAVLAELANAVRSGARDAGATIGLNDLMGTNRAGLDEVFRHAIGAQMSKYAEIDKVYIRGVTIPANIQQLWTQTIAMSAEQTKARAAFVTDSLNARRTVINAEAAARKTELETRALATSPEVLRLRVAEAMASGLANICSNATTCIIGGSVMDTWKNPLQR